MKSAYLLILPLFFFFFLLIIPAAHALEADQYWIWEKKEGLKDSTEVANEYLNQFLEEFLAKYVNVKSRHPESQECSDIAYRFLRYIRPHFFRDRLKSALLDDEQVDKFPEKSRMLTDYPQSIYRGVRWPFVMPVAQNLKINGVTLGTDKIDHFFSSGRRYFNVYLKQRKKGKSHEEAIKKALDFGLSIVEEKGILGYWSSGAFSYADIESNYRGMTLGINMCSAKDPHIKYNENSQKWVIHKKIDMKDYVNPLWDEAFNNSYYFSYRWNGIKKVLEEKYCELGLSSKVQRLWQSYRKRLKSDLHIEYLQALMREGTVPDPKPQSLHEACRYPDGVMEGVPFWNVQKSLLK